MEVVLSDGTLVPPNPYVRLDSIGYGRTFRMPKGGGCEGTVWMVTHNKATHRERKHQVRCVSLKAGSVSYKDADREVVRVKGRFVIDDWGEG